MKKNKIIFTMILLFMSFILVRAEAINEIDVVLYNMPEAGESNKSYYGGLAENGYISNTDKVYFYAVESVVPGEGNDYVFHEGETVKIKIELDTFSINDYIPDDAIIDVVLPDGTHKKLNRNYFTNDDYLYDDIYEYEFDYVIPSESNDKNLVEIASVEDGKNRFDKYYVVNGSTFRIPSITLGDGIIEYYGDCIISEDPATEGKCIGINPDGKKYYAGNVITPTTNMQLSAYIRPKNVYTVTEVVEGAQGREYEVTENEYLRDYLHDTSKDGFDISPWYIDSDYKHQYDYDEQVTRNITVYAYAGYNTRISADEHGKIQLDGKDVNNGSINDYIKNRETKTYSLKAIPDKGYAFLGWKYDYSDLEYVSTNAEYEFTATQDYHYLVAVFDIAPEAKKVCIKVLTSEYNDATSCDMVVGVESGDKFKQPEKMYDIDYSIPKYYETTGYYLDKDFNEEFDFDTEITNDITIYAKWEETNKTLFTINMGTNSYGTMYYVAKGDKLTKPNDPVSDGKVFDAWRTEFYNGYANMFEEFDFNTPIYKSFDLYEEYVDKYIVTFNTNGGKTIESIATTNAKNRVLELPTPVYAGHTFTGWYTDENLTNKFVANNYKFTADLTLYAGWTLNKYNVTFETNGGSSVANKTLDYGTTLSVNDIESVTKEGHEFTGWYTDSELKNKFNGTTVENDMTLYAGWNINKYTVSFESNTGSAVESKIYEYGQILNAGDLEVPTKEKFKFSGWYTDEALTTMFTEVKVTSDIKLYAGWKRQESDELTGAQISIAKGDGNRAIITINNYFINQKYTLEKSTNKKNWSTVKTSLTEDAFTATGITYGQKTYYRVKTELGGKRTTSNIVYITVKPDKVNNIRITAAGTKNIKVAWDKAGYTGYEVQRSTKATTGFKRVKFVTKSKTTSYNNTKLKNATTYYYRVRAYKTVRGKKVYGPWSDVASATTGPATPKKPGIKAIDYTTIQLNLKGTKTAKYYEVQRSTKKKKGFTLQGATETLTFVDGDIETGTTYYYKVRACNERNVCSGWTSVVSKKAMLKTPSISLNAVEPGKVEVTHNTIDGADGYEIQKSTKSAKKGFKKVTDTTELSFTVEGLKSGQKVYYKVRAYRMINGKRINGPWSKVLNKKAL